MIYQISFDLASLSPLSNIRTDYLMLVRIRQASQLVYNEDPIFMQKEVNCRITVGIVELNEKTDDYVVV